MKVIFLDFDGVINNAASRLYNPPTTQRPDWLSIWDPSCADCVNEIVRATDAKIVVSSAWRCDHDRASLVEIMEAAGIENADDLVIGVTPIWKSKDGMILSSYLNRAQEIRSYLSKDKSVDSYVILDDMEDIKEDPVLQPHFVMTDDRFGLQPQHVERAIEILNED